MAHKGALQPPISSVDDPEYAANLRRATLASTVGSALEYFGFAPYGLASALNFPKLFFTNLVSSLAHWAACTSAQLATGWAARRSRCRPSC